MAVSQLLDRLLEYAGSIGDPRIRQVVQDMLKDPVLTFTDARPQVTLHESPAAPRKHHFFTGGLLLHTLGVVELAVRIRDYVETVYGLKADRDLVIAAAILHDLFKYYQYEKDEAEGGYKPRGDWYVSHDYSLVAELAKRGAPDRLIRAVVEAHGLQPFTTLEGLIVHIADSADARLVDILQQVLVNNLKTLDKEGCNPIKVIDEKARRVGANRVFESLFEDRGKLIESFKQYCGGGS
ncbi:HD superfamily metal-dependent phosphohydrolase [Thermogladius calderae 1633]|uniref:HD superfamily metal-dependent phosphohydrolase n=1 Tax=Thermogladius calderae (strain DSM 22663 / VKM B-2946 / 1633) TaxID=1184251 RepID=I3TF09_THEC1|nr:HD superfamily metal-dependent phosphohydrolase [Thermogladius calderae 1633]